MLLIADRIAVCIDQRVIALYEYAREFSLSYRQQGIALAGSNIYRLAVSSRPLSIPRQGGEEVRSANPFLLSIFDHHIDAHAVPHRLLHQLHVGRVLAEEESFDLNFLPSFKLMQIFMSIYERVKPIRLFHGLSFTGIRAFQVSQS